MIRDMVVRWNSLWAAMDRFLELKKALEIFWTKYCKEYKLTEEEWTFLSELHETLGPLYAATLELQSEKQTSISKVIPLVNRLKTIYRGNKHSKIMIQITMK